VNNVELMLQAIDRDPDDLTAVGALTDLLYEDRGMTWTEAERYSENAVRAARDARDLAAAAALLRAEQPWHGELCRDILNACGLSADTVAQIIIAPGEAQPRFSNPLWGNAERFWVETTVTVGALWILRHCRKQPWRWTVRSASPITGKPKRKRAKK